MKVAITAQGTDLSAAVDPRFGRAQNFVVADTDSRACHGVDNSMNLQAAQGAGIQAGRRVAELGVEAVLTGQVGPKAFATLQAAGIAVYTGAKGTVAEALEQFRAGQLHQADTATVQGHWTP